jgi:hypothetical protein
MARVEDPPQEPAVVAEVGGLVDEFGATLCIYADDLDPDALTRELGIAPTRAFVRGTQRGRSQPSSHGAWLLEVRGEAPREPDHVLRELLSRLAVDSTTWARILATHRVRITLGVHVCGWTRGFALLPPVLLRLAELGVEVGFDIYAHGEDGAA